MYKVNNWVISPNYPVAFNYKSKEEKRIGTHDYLVLMILCNNLGNIVTKDDLLEKAWPGKLVSEGSLVQSVRNIRNLLEDNGKEQKYLKTIARVGYKLEASAVSYIEDPEIEKRYVTKLGEPDVLVAMKAKRGESRSVGDFNRLNYSLCGVFVFILVVFPYWYLHQSERYPSATIYKVFESEFFSLYWNDVKEGERIAEKLSRFNKELFGRQKDIKYIISRTQRVVSIVILRKGQEPLNKVFLLNGNDDKKSVVRHIKDEIRQHLRHSNQIKAQDLKPAH